MSGAKKLIFEQFALVGQALSSGHRLELLDLLVQGERSVDALARASGLTFANASQHLLQLRRAGLVTSRRDGKRVIYALSDPQVWDVVRAVRAVADALELLRPNGFSARRLDGGFSEWLAADLPVVRT